MIVFMFFRNIFESSVKKKWGKILYCLLFNLLEMKHKGGVKGGKGGDLVFPDKFPVYKSLLMG